MNKLSKVLISVFVIVSTLTLASIYFVSTKLNSETIKDVLVKTIEENLYQTKAKIAQVDYSLGTSVRISVEGLSVASIKDDSKLLEFSQLKIQIPILAILTRGGVIDIETVSPHFYLTKKENLTNWQKALNQNPNDTDKKSKNIAKKQQKKVELPSFVNKSKINLKVLDAQLFLNLSDESRGEFKLDRFILKNINLVNTTAFEISSMIQYQMSPDSAVESEVQIIGEINLNEFIENFQISSSMQFKIAKTKLTNMPSQLPMFKGMMQTQGNLDKLQLTLSGQLDSTLDLEAQLKYTPEVVSIEKINLSINNKNALKNFAPEVHTSLKSIDFNDSKTDIKGAIEIKIDPLLIRPKLSLDLSQNKTVDYNFEGLKFANSLSGSFVDESVQLSVNTQTMEGTIDTKIATEIDLLNIQTDLSKLAPINITSDIQGVKISKNKIQEIIWENQTTQNNPKKVNSEENLDTNQAKNPVQLPKVFINLTGEQILIGDQEISFEAKIVTKNDSILGGPIQLNYGSGSIKPQFTYKMLSDSSFASNFNLNFNKVEVTAFNAFFPPYLSDLKGVFRGEVKGNISKTNEKVTYNISTDLNGRDGDLDKLNIAAILNPLLEKVEFLKGKLPSENNVSTKFESLRAKANITSDWVELDRLNVVGHKDISKLEMNGDISMNDQTSKLTGSLYTAQSAPEIKKLTGQTNIPFRLTGQGFAIYNPDIGYTSKKLLAFAGDRLKKDAAKSLAREKKKAEKEIKKKIESEVEKQKKKLEKTLKEKLKGISL